ASLEYLLGTLAGAVYATLVALLLPHGAPVSMGVALALAIAPLAFAAASSSVFRVAPFTAVIVLLLAGEQGQGPMAAATTRLVEVALGGGVAVAVSLLVVPESAQARGRQAAAAALERLADALPVLLVGLSQRSDPAEARRVQDALGPAVAAFDLAVADAKHEEALSFTSRSDPAPLSRTMLRLRHDLVIVGRAAAEPLPDTIVGRLAPLAAAFGSSAAAYLAASARALSTRRPPPAAAQVEPQIDAYMSEVAAMREAGLTRTLSTSQLEQLFALGFAFDEIRRNLTDLERCIGEWAAA
ncbi:MAG TPA: FUSC family protein, partial [Caulobacteraceae bacterium]|nr:FUSC family protein [Caulobacteraceae bacterium]